MTSNQAKKLLAQKIDSAREEKGLTKTGFASLMQVQPSVITRWLSGKHNFTLSTLYQIERKLGIQIIKIS